MSAFPSVRGWPATPTCTCIILMDRCPTSKITCTLGRSPQHPTKLKLSSRETSSREHRWTIRRLNSHSNITRNDQDQRIRISKSRRLHPRLMLVSTEQPPFRISPLPRHPLLWLWARTGLSRANRAQGKSKVDRLTVRCRRLVSLDRCTLMLGIPRMSPLPLPMPAHIVSRLQLNRQRGQ